MVGHMKWFFVFGILCRFQKIAKKRSSVYRSSNHQIKIRILWVCSLDLFSDLNFYYRPSYFAIFWNRHKIPNTKIHFIYPTTKFYLRTIISEPCLCSSVSESFSLIFYSKLTLFLQNQLTRSILRIERSFWNFCRRNWQFQWNFFGKSRKFQRMFGQCVF